MEEGYHIYVEFCEGPSMPPSSKFVESYLNVPSTNLPCWSFLAALCLLHTQAKRRREVQRKRSLVRLSSVERRTERRYIVARQEEKT